jgi:rhodanese-related sulfurtransferase
MNRKIFLSTLAGGSLLLAAQSNANAAAPFVNLDAARTALEKSSMVVVDIREPSEHATGVAKGAVLMPIAQISRRINELPAPKTQPFLVICNTQNRSSRIVEQLQAMGYTNASYVMGGMSQWAQRGWPMIKPSSCYPKASC